MHDGLAGYPSPHAMSSRPERVLGRGTFGLGDQQLGQALASVQWFMHIRLTAGVRMCVRRQRPSFDGSCCIRMSCTREGRGYGECRCTQSMGLDFDSPYTVEKR